MFKYILVVLLFASVQSFADDWTTGDTWREVSFQGLAAMDWAQTRSFIRDPRYSEQYKQILTTHPSNARVNAVFATYMVGHYFIAKSLPENYRAAFQNFSIFFEVVDVYHNKYVNGISMKF